MVSLQPYTAASLFSYNNIIMFDLCSDEPHAILDFLKVLRCIERIFYIPPPPSPIIMTSVNQHKLKLDINAL